MGWKYVLGTAIISGALFALDLYVYRNWRRFALYRGHALRRTLPAYGVLLALMPFTLPAYLFFFRWWEVDPKWPRYLFFAAWSLYYLPKLPILVVIALKDAAKGAAWLFDWFKERLKPAAAPAISPAAVPASLDLADMPKLSRTEFLQKMGWTAAAVPFVVVGYSVFRSLYDFEVHRATVRVDGLPRALEGMMIAQISDLHAGSLFSAKPMQEAVDLVMRLQPDLVAVTGDFVNHDAAETPLILPALNRLKAPLGVYGCFGNHDHYANIRTVGGQIAETPIRLLVNQNRTISVDGAALSIVGTDNTGFNQNFANLPEALRGVDAERDGFRLLLAHDPTFWDKVVRPGFPQIDLMLAGHTHGGQFGFELGPLRWSLAQIMYSRWAGLYGESRTRGAGTQYLYVNRGLSTVGPPIRIGIRPEVTLLTLTGERA